MELKDKKILITGGANGIGKELVKLLYTKGADITVWDRDVIGLEDLKRSIPHITTLDVDVTDANRIKFACQQLGQVDILINNAGMGHCGPLGDVKPGKMEKLVNINFIAPYYITHKLLPTLKERKGHIVNIGSGQSFFKLPTWSAYAATKSALSTWSELLEIELAKHQVKVTTVYPFMVNTGFYKGVEDAADTWATKMSMKLLPFYSNKPQTVAKIILRAIEKKKRVEMVHPLNWVGYYMDTIPAASRLLRRVLNRFLSK